MKRIDIPQNVSNLMMTEGCSFISRVAFFLGVQDDTFTPSQVRDAVRKSSLSSLSGGPFYFADNFRAGVPVDYVAASVEMDVRKIIVDVLRNEFELKVYANSTVKRGRKWCPDLSNRSIVLKKRSFFKECAGDFPVGPFDHPNLVNEKVYRLDSSSSDFIDVIRCWLLSVAPDLSDIPILSDVSGDFSESDCFKIILDAMKGCAFLHGQGKVHRDIKPENIMVFRDESGVVGKLFDFEGVVKARSDVSCFFTNFYNDSAWFCNLDDANAIDDFVPNFSTDVFSFGMTLAQIFLFKRSGFSIKQMNNNEFWEKSVEDKKDFFDDFVYCFLDVLEFRDKESKEVVRRMFDVDPYKRPSLEECMKALESLKC